MNLPIKRQNFSNDERHFQCAAPEDEVQSVPVDPGALPERRCARVSILRDERVALGHPERRQEHLVLRQIRQQERRWKIKMQMINSSGTI